MSNIIGKVEEGEAAAVKALIAEFQNIKTKAEADLKKADAAIRSFVNHIIAKAGGDPAIHVVNVDTGEVTEPVPTPEAEPVVAPKAELV